MTPEQISACSGCSVTWAQLIIADVEITLNRFEINTPLRQAAFLAQMGHESGLKPIQENLNYSAERLKVIFPKYFDDEDLDKYAHNPKLIANRVYGSRMGNGGEETGDGWTFRGRGWVQLTGRGTYHACGKFLQIDLENKPDMLLENHFAALSAGWFWDSRNLNQLADMEKMEAITRSINGGLIGFDERMKLYEAGKIALGVA